MDYILQHRPFWSKRTTKNELDFGQNALLESMVFGQNLKILTMEKRISLERASQEEQNGANFSFIAPSILE